MRKTLQIRVARLEQARDGGRLIVVEGRDGADLEAKLAAAEAAAPRGAVVVGLRRFSDTEGGPHGSIA